MKVKLTIDDGNGKTAELEITDADKITQAVLIQNDFELFNIDTDFLEKEQKMSKIEKAYAKFFDEVDPIEREKLDSEAINDKMTKDFQVNKDELINTYNEKNDQPEFVRTGIKIRDGIEYYKLHYRCHTCYDRGTLYVPLEYKHVWCRRCDEQLEINLATNEPFPARDTFGNFFVAGTFKDWNV